MRMLLWCLLTLFASGCALEAKLPVTHMLSPEANGKLWNGRVDIRTHGVADIEVVDNMLSSTPGTTPDIGRNSVLGLGLDMGLVESVDVFAYTAVGTPAFIGLKWQLLGQPELSANKGNFSLALLGAWAGGSVEESLSNDTVKGKGKISFQGWEAAVLAGYRFHEKALVYFGPYFSDVTGKAEVSRTESGVTTVTAQPEGQGLTSSLNLGIQLGKKPFHIRLEGAYADVKWTRTSPAPEIKTDRFTRFMWGGSVALGW